ncbi:transport and Golgi organization protein 1 homolog [Cavia porcellus]|uniref:transport and Golgi organization protein 1 homolog n=1 Tax=Cavia porcellus TaxID=10141 RepID=UPI002FE2A2E2
MDTVSATVAWVFTSPGTPELLKPLSKLYSAFVTLLLKLVAVLPENLQPGPGDFYGLPWEPVLLTTCVGILMLVIFLWRNVFPVSELTCSLTSEYIEDSIIIAATQQGSQAPPCSFTPCPGLTSSHSLRSHGSEGTLLILESTVALPPTPLSWHCALLSYTVYSTRKEKTESALQRSAVIAAVVKERIYQGGENKKAHMQQLMDVSRTHPTISIFQKDLQLLQLKLRASLSAKCDLEDQIMELGEDCGTLQADKAWLEEEFSMLQQKVEILKELSHQKELELQKILSQADCAQQQREQALLAVDEKVVPATEEVKIYKIGEMEAELEKTEHSFKNQLATEKKKAHENWLASLSPQLRARNAERLVADEKRQAANLRQRLVEITQKLDMLKEEPGIIKRMPDCPGVQNAPHRGPLSQKGCFSQSPESGGECSLPPGAEPPGWLPSGSLNFACCDIARADFDPGPGPVANSSSRGSSPAKDMDNAKVSMAVKGPPAHPGPLFLGGPMPPHVGYGSPLSPLLCRPFGPRPMPPRPPPPFAAARQTRSTRPSTLSPVQPPQLLGPEGPFRQSRSASLTGVVTRDTTRRLALGEGRCITRLPGAGEGKPLQQTWAAPQDVYACPSCFPVARMGPPLGLRDYAPGMLPRRHDLTLHPREFLPEPVPFRPPGPLGARAYFISDPRMPPPPAGLQDY